MSLTDREIRNITPTSKRQRYFDERGLYLEVAPSGGKWWRFKYRFAGKEILSVIPISASAWWAGVASGKYPPAIKLGARTTVWRAEDIIP